PFGAPGLFPPCIRHRRLPLTAGDWHSVPDRVRARQRCASANIAGCFGLNGCFSIFPSPTVVVELIGNDSLPALIDVNMPHVLLSRLVQLRRSAWTSFASQPEKLWRSKDEIRRHVCDWLNAGRLP